MKLSVKTILLCMSLFAIVTISSISARPCYADEIENLIKGGDFEEDGDLQHWGIGLREGIASMTRDEEESVVGDFSLFFEIEEVSPISAINPDLYNNTDGGITLEKGETYTWSAFLKAEAVRDVRLYVQLERDPWTVYANNQVTVGEEWEEYWVTFEQPETATPVRVWFLNTGSDIDFWVDGARLFVGEYVPTEIEGIRALSTTTEKIATTWAAIKDQ